MATANLHNEGVEVQTGNDGIVIVDVHTAIRGGRTLITTGDLPDVISAGHVIIKDTTVGEYKPMPVSGGAYASLPANHAYVGILINTIKKDKPFAGIMTAGVVNQAVTPYPMTSILSAFKTAVPHIQWTEDGI